MNETVIEAGEQAAYYAADALVAAGVPGVNFTKLVEFKSRIMSPYYMDCRKIPGNPQSWEWIVDAFDSLVGGVVSGEVEAVAGIQTGAIPLSSVLAYSRLTTKGKGPMPHYAIRKEEKDHGLLGLIDGGNPAGKRVLLIEDMITTSDSLWRGVEALKNAGADVVGCMAIMSYDFRGANQRFADAGIPLGVLTTLEEVLDAMVRAKTLTELQRSDVREWHKDPKLWYVKWLNGHRPA